MENKQQPRVNKHETVEIGDSIACELHTVKDRLLVSKLTTQAACDKANELLKDSSKGWYVIKHHDSEMLELYNS